MDSVEGESLRLFACLTTVNCDTLHITTILEICRKRMLTLSYNLIVKIQQKERDWTFFTFNYSKF